MIFEYRPIFGGIKFDVVLIPDEILTKYKCKRWRRARRIDSWQNQLCIFITQRSILIFVTVLENSSQRAYFRSCDGNTATPLADKREIGRFMGFPMPY